MGIHMPSFRTVGVTLVATAFAAALGATLGAYLIAPPVPDSLSAPAPVTSAPVSTREFTDERSVQMLVTIQDSSPIPTPRPGRVTELFIQNGQELSSGVKVMSIDAQPIIAIHTSIPVFRDIADGVEGQDIHALQEELVRMGFSIAVDGKVGRDTRFALARLIGINTDSDTVPDAIEHTHFLWIPASQVTVSELKVRLGDVVAEAAPLLSFGTSASTGRIEVPQGNIAGARLAIFEHKEYPVPETGVVDNQDLLQAVANSPIRSLQGEESSSTIAVSLGWKLETPISVQVVPAQAVFDAFLDKGCVSSGGKTVPVRIIGSELGQTFIQTEQALSEVDMQVEGLTCQ